MTNKPNPKTVELVRTDYQPTKREKEAAGVEAYIWRPSDWREGRIARVLGR